MTTQHRQSSFDSKNKFPKPLRRRGSGGSKKLSSNPDSKIPGKKKIYIDKLLEKITRLIDFF